ncbi:hypothetical protein PoB_002399400 [Plakobranchus ocellatus]|uniref:Uncharacterized protein n=1 Tax=Plakobranchus ocellatus TaxID=259542 RepID=A0AAV3ZSV4_9GAST|nr:hypothetical protein PoB_002399400 [Plakobranchus ocellatus]
MHGFPLTAPVVMDIPIMEQDPPQSFEPSTSSAGQKRIAKMFNVSDAQILLDNIRTDYSTCTDEEPDSDPDDQTLHQIHCLL